MELNERIAREALCQFIERGIKAVSMDDVARSLGISKRTLYEHFDSKDALLAECIKVMVQEKENNLDNLLGDAKSFFELFIHTMYQGLRFSARVNPQFMQDLKRYNFQTANEAYQQRKDEHYRRIRQLVDDGKEQGLIEADIDSEMMAMMMTDMPPFHPRHVAAQGRWPVFKVMMQLIKIFLRGIATERGYSVVTQALGEMEKKLETQQ